MEAMARPVVVLATALALLAGVASGVGPEGPGPFGPETDCALRGLMLRYAPVLQPAISDDNLGHV